MATRRGSAGDLMEEATTQSAAEDEEDLLLMQQEAQSRHTAASSAFSTSSVDQFLRDNGFQIDEMDDDDDVLSSSADGDNAERSTSPRDDSTSRQQRRNSPQQSLPPLEEDEDAAAAVERLLRVDAMVRTPRDATGDSRVDDVLSSDGNSSPSSSAAAGEGDLPTPRFILLDDEDLLSVSKQTSPRFSPPPPRSSSSSSPRLAGQHRSEWSRFTAPRTERMGSSFDRSMLLGGSGLSALSEESRGSSAVVERGEEAAATSNSNANYRKESTSLSSSGVSSSLLGSPPSTPRERSMMRSQDDELSDALGVRSSLSPQERVPSSAAASAPAVAPAADASMRQRLQPRRLATPTKYQEEDEEEEKNDTTPLPQTSRNPWHQPDQREEVRGDASGNVSETQKAQWADVNVLLRKNGLPTVQLRELAVVHARGHPPHAEVVPNHSSMVNLVQEFVLQIDRKNETIQDLIMDSNRTNKVQSKAEDGLASLERKTEELRNSLQSAQNETNQLQKELRRQKDDTEKQVKAIKTSCLKLQQQLKVSEHRVKAKEVLVERMQKKLQQQVDKENLNKTRDRKIFKQLHQRDPRKANAKDTQSLECIGIYETQREQMQQELDRLRNHVAALNSEVRDKENTLSRRSSLSQSGSGLWESEAGASSHHRSHGDPSDEMLLRLEVARREQEQAAARLRQRESIMVKKISSIEEELLSAREAIAELKDENANLSLEAESRPSIRDYRLSQRRIHQLERQLSENKLALEEANDINELRRFMGTTDLIERDRLNHRLHLNRLGTLPKETLLEVVKEVCRVLNLTDITLITPSLHKLCNVVTAVPRMERFIRDVCGFVYFNTGQEHQEENARFELEHVLPTLQQWTIDRKKLFELEGFKVAIVSELCKRSVEPSLLNTRAAATNEGDSSSSPTQLSSLPRAVQIVAELIELEKSVIHHREIYTQAAQELERRPAVLVNQIVRHFSHLFHVKKVEGVLPKINEVYLFASEMENFAKGVRTLLGLKPEASLPVCMDAIRSHVEGDVPQHKRPEQDENAPPDSANYVVEKSTRGVVGPASGGVEGVRQVREMTVLVRDLKKELGAATMQEILPRTRRLMELLSLSIHQAPVEDGF